MGCTTSIEHETNNTQQNQSVYLQKGKDNKSVTIRCGNKTKTLQQCDRDDIFQASIRDTLVAFGLKQFQQKEFRWIDPNNNEPLFWYSGINGLGDTRYKLEEKIIFTINETEYALFPTDQFKNIALKYAKSFDTVPSFLALKYSDNIYDIFSTPSSIGLNNDDENIVIYDTKPHCQHMQIFCKGYPERICTLDVAPNYTAFDVAYKLSQRGNVCSNGITLIFAGKQLEDEQTLSDYGIQREATLYSMQRLRGS